MDTIGKKLALKEKMAYGCGDAASNIIWAIYGNIPDVLLYRRGKYHAATIGSHFSHCPRVINAVVALLTWMVD